VYQNSFQCKCLILLTAFFSLSFAKAQQSQVIRTVDSIKALIPNARDTAKYRLVFNVAYELFDVNNHEAVRYAEKAYILAKEFGDSLEITKSGRLLGQLLRRVDELDEAILRFSEVLPIAERNKYIGEEKRILNALALAYNFKAVYDQALDYNFKSLEIREQEGDKKEIANALNNIGLVYYKMNDLEHALDYYNKALITKQEVNDEQGLDQILINLALCYGQLRDYDKTIEYVYKAFEACEGHCNDQINMQGEFCLGRSLLDQNKYQDAIVHFNKSYSTAKAINDKRQMAENCLSLGFIFLEQGDYEAAEKKLRETESLSKESGYNQILINTYLSFSRLYGKMKIFEKEAFFQSKYITLKDSVYSDQLIRNLAKVQTKYQQRENLKTIAQQDEVLKLKEEVISRQKTQYFFILTITILSILLTFVFIRFNRSQQQANVELTRAKREIENKNQELEINNAALDARVQERTTELQQSNRELQKVNDELDNFIYKTSHDIRGPLASLKGMTNVAMLDVKDPIALEYFKKLDVSAEKLNSILTRLVTVNHINHVTLISEKIDCQEIIEDILLVERKKGVPAKMAITYHCDQQINLRTDRSVLRLALENLIDNAIKFYSDSARIEPFVRIEAKPKSSSSIEIVVTDNGIGIQESDQQKLFHMFMRASERSETGGIGLYLAKLSTEKLGGEISFSLTAEGHTRFSIELPADLGKGLSKEKQEENLRVS